MFDDINNFAIFARNKTIFKWQVLAVDCIRQGQRRIERNAKRKSKQRKLDTLKNKMVKSEQQVISNICKVLQSQGVSGVVFILDLPIV